MTLLTPLPLLVWSAVAAALLWAFDPFDDFVGGALVILVAHGLLWLGLRGDPQQRPRRGARVALAIGGALPTAAVVLAMIPWTVRGDGLAGLGVVIGMVIFATPGVVAAFAVVLYLLSARPRQAILARVVTIVGVTTACAWLLAGAWALRADTSATAGREMLVFPALATWWWLLPAAAYVRARG